MRGAAKATKTILLLVLAGGLAGCAMFGTTRKERVMRFEVGLNENRQYLYMDFYEPRTSDYSSLRSADVGTTWDAWFPPAYPDPGTYTVTVDDQSGDIVDATVTGPAAFAGPKTLRLYMVRVGVDWYIEKLVLDGTTIVD